MAKSKSIQGILKEIREGMGFLVKILEQNTEKENSETILDLSRKCRDAFSMCLDKGLHWEAEWVRSLAYFYASIYEKVTGIPEYPGLSYTKWEKSRSAKYK